ncbi:hypothetical protein [uncultured Mucilaginibacter sp.]|uniref:hypothetical protein n=1 Tax=uncultured Mucilaginibacter sp. TaxID=797541 RepID=UPI0025D17929|nr:hypothetical protein [uncultured Mucilaginibacter sp.]
MKALVFFDTVPHDTALAIELDREMEELGWSPLETFSYAFEKEFEADYYEIETQLIANVDAATFEAEWQDVKYMYMIGVEEPKFGLSKGQ